MKTEVELSGRDDLLLQTCVATLLRDLLAKKQLPENINNDSMKCEVDFIYNLGVNLILQLQGSSKNRRQEWEVALNHPPVKLKIGRHYITGDDYDVVTESLENQIRKHAEDNEEARAKPYRELLAKLPVRN